MNETRSIAVSLRASLLGALPALVLLLSFFAWMTAVSRSGFWADDFLNLTHFARSLGDLSDDRINEGKYIINVFWGVGTQAFGSGSVVPFLLLNSSVFAAGVLIWLTAGSKSRWSPLDAWWVAGIFTATAAWFPTALWSSNITHSGGFLALGIGLFTHERAMRASSAQKCLLWTLLSGIAWTLAIVSNLLYIGLLVVALYCAIRQCLRLRSLGATPARAALAAGVMSLVVPVVYFATVAYPSTTASSVYATNGVGFIHQNYDFYKASLAPSALLQLAYVGAILLAVIGGALAARRGNWFPIAVSCAALATALPALIQGQQRDVHYMAMPILLLSSAVAAGVPSIAMALPSYRARVRGVLLVAATATLLLVFRQGADVRSYFVQSPYGQSLATFRSKVASLVPPGTTICAELALDSQQQSAFIAEMSGTNGFAIAPINAAQTFLVPAGQKCPAVGAAAHVLVQINAHGDLIATGR